MIGFKKYLRLFFDFFKVGLFTFGGGYAMISLMSGELVDKRNYVSQSEFSDVVAIAESTPGPIAINSATYIGYKVGGVLGSIIASLAVSLPSFIIIYVISVLLPNFLDNAVVQKAFRGVQCAVVVLIVSAAFKLLKTVKKNFWSVALIAASAGLLLAFDLLSVNVSTIFFIIVGGAVGFALYFPKSKKERQAERLQKEAALKADETNAQADGTNAQAVEPNARADGTEARADEPNARNDRDADNGGEGGLGK